MSSLSKLPGSVCNARDEGGLGLGKRLGLGLGWPLFRGPVTRRGSLGWVNGQTAGAEARGKGPGQNVRVDMAMDSEPGAIQYGSWSGTQVQLHP